MIRTSTRRVRMLAAGVCIVAVVAAAACSGDDRPTAQESLDALSISDSPAVVVASRVEGLDVRSAVGTELGSDYLRLKYARAGFSWADADCAVAKAIEVATPEAFPTLPILRLESLGFDHPELEAQLRTCASPESLARLDAGKVDPNVPTTTAAPGAGMVNAAPDIDGETVGAMIEAFYRMSADDLGLTPDETDCVVDAVLGTKTPQQFVDLAVGRDRIDIEKTAPDVAACLSEDRMDVLTPIAAKSLLAQKEATKAERDRVKAVIESQLGS